jgi:solute carrier family 25 phosphate transporter 3
MEAIRIRIVSEREFAVKGWVSGTRQMLRKQGIGFLSKGLTAMICKQIPYTMTKNVSFDFFAMRLYATLIRLGTPLTPGIKICVSFSAAVCASILSCISSQPGDMLLSSVNANGGGNQGTRGAIMDIMRSDKGVLGFFVGLKTRFLHVGVIVTLQLLLYDLIKRLCGIPATGL